MRTFEVLPQDSTAADRAPVAELEHVCFDYGAERVLDEVTLRVERGDFLGIIGPNGSGKTTLLRVLLGLAAPSGGHGRLFGTDVRAFRDWHRIGYIPQKATAFESRFPASVFEIVQSGRCARAGLGRRFNARDREASLRALDTVGMTEYRDRLVGHLSAGQQQRVFIARALAGEPDLLVLDEPTVGVDLDAQEQFYGLLRRLNRGGTTLMLVSHDIGVVAKEVSQLACLNRTLVFHGPPDDALASGALAQMYRAESLIVSHRH
ncbi:MAG: metal ABC transporter ATP-binding protein [Armatimonadota bacterium]